MLYANGSHDVMIDAYASYAAVQELPNAKLVLYSDAGHAFLFQHLDDFTREVTVLPRRLNAAGARRGDAVCVLYCYM